MWVSENAWAIRDANGDIVFYEGTVKDVTDRVNADRQLARARLQASKGA